MKITAALAAELSLLTEALDDPGFDVLDSLVRLAADVAAPIPTYCGLSVRVEGDGPPFTLTELEPGSVAADIQTSLRLGLAGDRDRPVVVILYAGAPGAFVDLAADIGWLTARSLRTLVLDGDKIPATDSSAAEPVAAAPLSDISAVNQAIGTLVGRGYSLEQAARCLVDAAAYAGISRHAAAGRILAAVTAPTSDHGCTVKGVGNPASPG